MPPPPGLGPGRRELPVRRDDASLPGRRRHVCLHGRRRIATRRAGGLRDCVQPRRRARPRLSRRYRPQFRVGRSRGPVRGVRSLPRTAALCSSSPATPPRRISSIRECPCVPMASSVARMRLTSPSSASTVSPWRRRRSASGPRIPAAASRAELAVCSRRSAMSGTPRADAVSGGTARRWLPRLSLEGLPSRRLDGMHPGTPSSRRRRRVPVRGSRGPQQVLRGWVLA